MTETQAWLAYIILLEIIAILGVVWVNSLFKDDK